MAEGSGNSNTAIWVAIITVVGSLLTAVIVNADKWIGRGNEPAAITSPTAATLVSPSPAAPVSSATPAANQPGLMPQTNAPAASAPEPELATFSLNGQWRDDDGGRYSFEQTGSKFELTQMSVSGNTQLFGRGTISGRDIEYSFELMTGEKGNCSGRINAAGTKITGNCTYSEGGWTYVITQ